jgi:hypothetical protein
MASLLGRSSRNLAILPNGCRGLTCQPYQHRLLVSGHLRLALTRAQGDNDREATMRILSVWVVEFVKPDGNGCTLSTRNVPSAIKWFVCTQLRWSAPLIRARSCMLACAVRGSRYCVHYTANIRCLVQALRRGLILAQMRPAFQSAKIARPKLINVQCKSGVPAICRH